MKAIYVGLKHDTYRSTKRTSFEYNNFYLTLKNMPGVELSDHFFDLIPEIGKERFNRDLLEKVKSEKPDLVFVFTYTDELDFRTLEQLKQLTTSIAWFADDYWRFWNYSRHYPPYYTWIITTYSKAAEWYKKAGFNNILLSQWACDTNFYKPIKTEKDIDVSFVGQYKPPRGKVVRALQKAGIKVEAFGAGWPNEKISQEDMFKVFSRSKINLNLNVRPGLLSPRVFSRIFFKKSIDRVKFDFHLFENLQSYLHFPILHTHARPFELAGCRAFVISGFSEDIPAAYKENEEMVFYYSIGDLISKINYYLKNDVERNRIAQSGYERTVKEHTYEKRFEDIFIKTGLKL